MALSRRKFLTYGTVASASMAGILWHYRSRLFAPTYAEVIPDPAGIIDLPPGFAYRILDRSGERMSDGHLTPILPDGMACFEAGDKQLVLMRNHEIHIAPAADRALAYDPQRGGGVTRLVLDKQSGALVSSNLVLTGTSRNCSGGPSPWGWLSCEEIDEPGHGYVFLCDPSSSTLQPPQMLPDLGRFKHEAAAVDVLQQVTYLTEDHAQGLVYRHVPHAPNRPFSGSLFALKLATSKRQQLSTGLVIGDSFEVEWVPITDPAADHHPTRVQGARQGAAQFSRGEGMWYHNDAVFISSTDGGPDSLGQIFRLDIDRTGHPDQLTLIAQSESRKTFDSPDNLTVSPTGQLFIAEDGSAPNLIRVMDHNNNVVPFARNALNDGSSEFAGICFSPDGNLLFTNLQKEGLTLAIWGPFLS